MKSRVLLVLLFAVCHSLAAGQDVPFYFGKWTAPVGGPVACDGLDPMECANRRKFAARMVVYEFSETLFEMGMAGVSPAQYPYRVISIADGFAAIDVITNRDGKTARFILKKNGDELCMDIEKVTLCMTRVK